MKVEVEIISKEFVKPSSPTPHHLRHYQLSLLDQITPQVYNSMVYFFPATSFSTQFNLKNVSDRLKTSLSKTLTYYHPLAGRLINNTFVDCNDDGVPYMEARVLNCSLNDVIKYPIPKEISKLLPFEMDEVLDLAVGVQLNIFDCGGIAIGACVSHKIGDALSYFEFIKSWTAVARGEQEQQEVIIRTHFKSAELFPPKDLSWYDPNVVITKENLVSKRFVFDASSIESLKEKYNYEGQDKPPSRVEALSSFIWTRLIATTQQEYSCTTQNKLYIVGHTVNFRPRMEPPLPDYAFGNYFRVVSTCPCLDEKGECLDMVKKLREELKKIQEKYLVQVREGSEEYLESIREGLSKLGKGETVWFSFTSLCRFPLYDVDFGWGKPTWVGPPTWKFKNVVALTDAKNGGGVEAYVSLTPEDMAKFENDRDLLAHVSTSDHFI